ncbi:MAG: metallophosphoesterase [Firmicutes bacterium]|nr:metallophosphoesterase [Bacillota bacterium]
MKEKLRSHWFPALSFLLTLAVSLFWVALRVYYGLISRFLGAETNRSFLVMNLPVLVCVGSWFGCALALVGLLVWNRRKWPAAAGCGIGIIAAIGAVKVIRIGARDYLRFIMVHFWKSAAVAACIIAFALLLLFPPKLKTWVKGTVIALLVVFAVVTGYRLRPCDFTYGAVVYAVEDDYQIVFSTSDFSIGWVEIDGVCYYDLYAGSMRSADRVHKVEVPQSVLDAAGGYTVCAKQMIYRGPFGGYTGDTICRSYDFRPVDASDGLCHVALSDVHEAVDAAIAAAETARNTDFLVLLGDMVSMVETEADAQMANEIAHGITKGEIPVIYARGNHEIKGEYAEELYKYVGSRNQEFYYTVTLGGGDVFAVVLDMGEEFADDYHEYYGTAHFDLYRTAQTRMLEELYASGSFENCRYRMALCHIPVVYVDQYGNFEDFCNEWTNLLNAMDMDIGLSGHEHTLWPLIPGHVQPHTTLIYSEGYKGRVGVVKGGYLTDFRYPNFLVGRRSLQQQGGTQKDGYSEYVCLETCVDFESGTQTSRYINSAAAVVSGWYPFREEAFTDIITDLR